MVAVHRHAPMERDFVSLRTQQCSFRVAAEHRLLVREPGSQEPATDEARSLVEGRDRGGMVYDGTALQPVMEAELLREFAPSLEVPNIGTN